MLAMMRLHHGRSIACAHQVASQHDLKCLQPHLGCISSKSETLDHPSSHSCLAGEFRLTSIIIRTMMPVSVFRFLMGYTGCSQQSHTLAGATEHDAWSGQPALLPDHHCMKNACMLLAAWISYTGGSKTRYPAQVQVEVYKACPALPET